MLVQLLYASRLSEGTTAATASVILQQARLRNPDSGITGVLCHGDHLFLQLLEGGREQVNALFARIQRDTRHTDVTLLHYGEVTQRRFPSWTMAQTNLEKLNPGMLLRYSALPVFDPFQLPGSSSMALVDELVASASLQGRA